MNRIFRIYLNKPYSYFTENKAGDLVQRKIMQTQKAAASLKFFILLLGNLTIILGVLLVLCFMSLKATLAISVFMASLYYVTIKTSREKIYKAGDRIVELEKKGFGLTTELLSGIKQVKIFCAEDHFQNKIQKIWNEYSRHSIQNQFLSSLPRPVLETFVVLAGVGTLMMFGNVAGQGKEIFPTLAVFAVGMYRIFPLAAASSVQAMSLAAQLPFSETVANILKEEIEKEKGRALIPMADSIKFQNVSFSYSDRDKVLDNISLTFKNNNFYGVVGVSGSGKSTIIDLISGF